MNMYVYLSTTEVEEFMKLIGEGNGRVTLKGFSAASKQYEKLKKMV